MGRWPENAGGLDRRKDSCGSVVSLGDQRPGAQDESRKIFQRTIVTSWTRDHDAEPAVGGRRDRDEHRHDGRSRVLPVQAAVRDRRHGRGRRPSVGRIRAGWHPTDGMPIILSAFVISAGLRIAKAPPPLSLCHSSVGSAKWESGAGVALPVPGFDDVVDFEGHRDACEVGNA